MALPSSLRRGCVIEELVEVELLYDLLERIYVAFKVESLYDPGRVFLIHGAQMHAWLFTFQRCIHLVVKIARDKVKEDRESYVGRENHQGQPILGSPENKQRLSTLLFDGYRRSVARYPLPEVAAIGFKYAPAGLSLELGYY